MAETGLGQKVACISYNAQEIGFASLIEAFPCEDGDVSSVKT